MNTLAKLTASAAVVLLSGSMAFADCVDTTASTTSDAVKTPPVAKDGSTAPLEEEPADSAQQADAEPTQKDGSNMPLAESEGDRSEENLATSQQDVEAQQEGEQTAAATADDAC